MGSERRFHRPPSRARDEQVVDNGLRLVMRELNSELDAQDAVILQQQTKLKSQARHLVRLVDTTRSEIRKNTNRRKWYESFARVRMGGPTDTRIRVTRSVYRWYKFFYERWS